MTRRRGAPSRRAALCGLFGPLALWLGCAAGPTAPGWAPESSAPLPCHPEFPYRDGWLGGDSAYSVALSERETLWLFGDSFIGAAGQRDRLDAVLVHNSVGRSRCDRGRFRIDYYWGTDAAGRPSDFLPHRRGARERDDVRGRGDAPERWWWLFDGFTHAGALYIGLLEVEASAPEGPLSLPFRFVGVQLARVENPADPPGDWRVAVLPLRRGGRAMPASAMLVHERWLYLFTFMIRPDGTTPRALARLPTRALETSEPDLAAALEYLARDGRWKPGLDPADARILMEDNATEMSVNWHDALSRWLAVYSHPNAEGNYLEDGPSPAVFVRTAPSLTGPWSEPEVVFLTPEHDARAIGGRDPATACYAAKEHPQYSPPGGITFTYVCNLFTPPGGEPYRVIRRLLTDMKLYRPYAVSLSLPASGLRGTLACGLRGTLACGLRGTLSGAAARRAGSGRSP